MERKSTVSWKEAIFSPAFCNVDIKCYLCYLYLFLRKGSVPYGAFNAKRKEYKFL